MPRGEHRPSTLLSRDENEQVFSLIGPKCQSLATAVVQLFTTEGPAHSEWKKKDTGVLCLIKDNGRRSYFFRIYCLYRKAMIWEHEVYLQIEYKSPRPYLHTFEAEDYMTAFNFANEDEAKILRDTLIEKIELRKQRRQGGNYTLKSKKPKGRKLTKADIGSPKDFQHISHVGWDANKGFDVDLPEEEMRSFFSKAGISETQLQDHDTMEFVYDFINSHGGINAVKDDLHDAPRQKSNSTCLFIYSCSER
ncbi:Neural Wiskott-Aldrich syndrome protein [Papilio machaon]|uniref:Neural Wiskott-Aldrich syndrome protein n=1 Tax=Papilio machaon TaxID=76193 RepID=A0A194RK70_PAPMA|nr:Neural Wiskott-Aldrich syndrome protein [Papilio machaon]